MTNSRKCNECGGSDLEWDVIIQGECGIQDGNHRLHEMRSVFFLGCNECGSTVQVASEDAILNILNKSKSGSTL